MKDVDGVLPLKGVFSVSFFWFLGNLWKGGTSGGLILLYEVCMIFLILGW